MKCPLLMAGLFAKGGSSLPSGNCLKKECAWWDDRYQQCLVVTATEQLFRLGDRAKIRRGRVMTETERRDVVDRLEQPGGEE